MNQYIRKFVVAAAMALAVSGVVQAKDDDDGRQVCSVATLDGLYVFTASGFNVVGSGLQPKAIVELIQFDGRGTLTVPAVTVSINGVIMRAPPPSSPPSTYSVGSDCAGALQFTPPPGFTAPITYDFFVGFKGSQIQMIQTGPGSPVFQGTAERISR
jgi:hypothetical protein